MRDADVKFLQSELSRLGYDLKADGDFGPGTLKAVKAFQQKHGLGADGVVGNGTWEVLLFDGRPVGLRSDAVVERATNQIVKGKSFQRTNGFL